MREEGWLGFWFLAAVTHSAIMITLRNDEFAIPRHLFIMPRSIVEMVVYNTTLVTLYIMSPRWLAQGRKRRPTF